MTSLGVVFEPQHPPELLREVVRVADAVGLEQLWLCEDCFAEGGISTAAAALAWSERVRIGVGVLPAPLRNVAVTAMEIATLERMFPGRTIWGVGHGNQQWMSQVGARVAAPLTLLREYLHALRSLLAGERITVRGRYIRLDDVALDWPPLTAPAVVVGGFGPRTLRLAGETADGVVTGTTLAGMPQAIDLTQQDRATDKPSADFSFMVQLVAATGPDAADRAEAEVRKLGHDIDDGLCAVGDAQSIAATIARWTQAGADTVILEPTPDEPDPVGFVRFIAEEVRHLLP
ncbi:LLM class flavin-dependent oxidoreductase [Nocardia sp. CDC159]|uniref:LLM class flavin-dependent oxidoreductase n=1 Tax=Nocardia pulmonis TaxID=2951408 RepID=A0A9X2EHM1_9NOCA|nr:MULTISPECIES: LLM class flavin-dependent oxidoreductase [Nocardia]MCM6778393.1 LLM class flavin-dependent oxidoreductase [Nocardia pulmonis]MCM6791211.1 LLM class flavin-dependent oxidoreductase [Nocardia sp. CDC159]